MILAAGARAQEAAWWRPLDRAEGLPADDVYGLCSGGPDRVWAATAGGLCRIEAHEIRVVGPEGVPRLVAPAPGGGVYALYPLGVAWVRADGRGEDWIGLPYDPARQTALAMAAGPDGTIRI